MVLKIFISLYVLTAFHVVFVYGSPINSIYSPIGLSSEEVPSRDVAVFDDGENYVSETETYLVEYITVDDNYDGEDCHNVSDSNAGVVSAVPFGYIRENDYHQVNEEQVEIIEVGSPDDFEPLQAGNEYRGHRKHRKITSAPVKWPFPVSNEGECKGNCPLKHNLLPKYEPDDGGQLKCPEHDGRKFRSKQGALFEVACYADYGGRNMKVETETSLDACINTCTSVTQCKAVVFVPGELDGACYLKFNQGKSHMNPFVMSARMAATECGLGVDCDRHNKVWIMEQEDARRERQRVQIEETRQRIDDLRKERADLERERHNQRMQRIKDHIAKEGQNRAAEADRIRYEAYAKQEEAYARQKQHEAVEMQRDQLREERRFKWRLATEERERERLRHQVEKEREALQTELDKMTHGHWANDEEWWRESRFKTHPAQEIKEFGKAIDVNAIDSEDEEFQYEGEYPTDDEWRWYPDPSWSGYWEAEDIEHETYEGWVTENEYEQLTLEDWREMVIDGQAIRRGIALDKRGLQKVSTPSKPKTQALKDNVQLSTESNTAEPKTGFKSKSVDVDELPIIESNVSERKRLNNTHQLVLGENISPVPEHVSKTFYFTYSDEDINLGFRNYSNLDPSSHSKVPVPTPRLQQKGMSRVHNMTFLKKVENTTLLVENGTSLGSSKNKTTTVV